MIMMMISIKLICSSVCVHVHVVLSDGLPEESSMTPFAIQPTVTIVIHFFM